MKPLNKFIESKGTMVQFPREENSKEGSFAWTPSRQAVVYHVRYGFVNDEYTLASPVNTRGPIEAGHRSLSGDESHPIIEEVRTLLRQEGIRISEYVEDVAHLDEMKKLTELQIRCR